MESVPLERWRRLGDGGGGLGDGGGLGGGGGGSGGSLLGLLLLQGLLSLGLLCFGEPFSGLGLLRGQLSRRRRLFGRLHFSGLFFRRPLRPLLVGFDFLGPGLLGFAKTRGFGLFGLALSLAPLLLALDLLQSVALDGLLELGDVAVHAILSFLLVEDDLDPLNHLLGLLAHARMLGRCLSEGGRMQLLALSQRRIELSVEAVLRDDSKLFPRC